MAKAVGLRSGWSGLLCGSGECCVAVVEILVVEVEASSPIPTVPRVYSTNSPTQSALSKALACYKSCDSETSHRVEASRE